MKNQALKKCLQGKEFIWNLILFYSKTKNLKANLIAFYRFTLRYLFNKLEIRVEVKIKIQKIINVKIKVLLLLIKTFKIFSTSSSLFKQKNWNKNIIKPFNWLNRLFEKNLLDF